MATHKEFKIADEDRTIFVTEAVRLKVPGVYNPKDAETLLSTASDAFFTKNRWRAQETADKLDKISTNLMHRDMEGCALFQVSCKISRALVRIK